MNIFELLLLIAGLVLLSIGAELLVRGASRLAAVLGISPLVIGLTVVAFGTSSPEMAVSVESAFSGQADIALGNVVGSNIFNVLFILGLCALILPLRVAQQLLWLDVPLMIGASILLLLIALDGQISRIDGVMLFGGIIAYTIIADVVGKGERGIRRGDDVTGVFKNSMIITVCNAALIPKVVEAIRPVLKRFGGICLVSDASYVIH